MSITVGTRVGVYEIAAPLGAGGMGVVFQAHDTKLGRDVAVKILSEALAWDPQRIARFQREAQLLASLNHPNLAQIYGFEETNQTSCIIMELVEGPTLAERLSLGPIPIEDALRIAKEIAEALEAAHERDIVHRDLKPANIKANGGRVKVLDFGLAKVRESDERSDLSNSPTMAVTATHSGVVLGRLLICPRSKRRGNPQTRDPISGRLVLFSTRCSPASLPLQARRR